jgi:hypothetical protein
MLVNHVKLSDIHLKDYMGNKWKRFHGSTFEVGQLLEVLVLFHMFKYAYL